MTAERRRLRHALVLSLLTHALLLSLTFGGQEPGLPGLGLPWRERRVEVPDLRVVLTPAQVNAAAPARASVELPLPPASPHQPVAVGPDLTPSAAPAPVPGRPVQAVEPMAGRTALAEPTAPARSAPDDAGAAPPEVPRRPEDSPDAAPAPIAEPALMALERSEETRWVVPAVSPVPTPALAATPSASSPQTVTPGPRDAGDAALPPFDPQARERAVEPAHLDRSQQQAQQQAVQLEAARIETARLEGERQEDAVHEAARQGAVQAEAAHVEAERQDAARQAAARQEAARQEAQRVEIARLEAERQQAERQAAARQEAARQEAQRVEIARLEAKRQQAERQAAARQEAARQEAQRVEIARLEAERQAARQEAARQEAQRVEIAQLEAERQQAARLAAARQDAARIEAAQEQAARREAALRAIGRELDEQAARREAASTAASLPSRLAPSSSSARRGRLFGRTDANAELVLYAEALARKIQLNMTFDLVREAAKRPHVDPLVTLAIRSDGSVESVTFVLSSGVAEIDDAIRRIVQSQVPYQAFPPGLAREFDVIEIRRTWHFDSAVRLY